MRAGRGMAWLAAIIWLSSLMGVPSPGMAAGGDTWGAGMGWRLPILQIAAQSAMEAQMVGEKPTPAPSQPRPVTSLLPDHLPTLQLGQEGGAALKLHRNLEMHISFLYNREPSSPEPKRFSDSPLLAKYSMDYRLLTNLQVGLSGYLYRPADDVFSFQRRVMGFGPEVKYDLGRWSFLVKSQMETGNRDRAEGMQNWFRVWYAF